MESTIVLDRSGVDWNPMSEEQRLARIETLLEKLTEAVEERQKESDERWRDIRRTVYGDGNGYRGLLVRIDRMEQAEKGRTWRERLMIVTIVGLLVEAFLKLL